MNICTKLLKTYNANILSKARPLEQRLFYKLARRNDGTHLPPNINTTLIKLINNYLANKAPHPKYIAGPHSLTLHWSDKFDLTVYIFGENHSTQEDCGKFGDIEDKMWIEDFLKQQILNTSAFLDIYVEWPVFLDSGQKYYQLYYKPSQNRLDQIYVKLKKCLVPFTRGNSYCDLVRLHYFDIRKGEHSFLNKNTNELSYLRYKFNKCIKSQKFKGICKIIHADTTLQYILRNLAATDDDTYLQFLEKQLINNPKVIKELDKSFLKLEILDFITTKILHTGQKYKQQFQECIPILLTTSDSKNYTSCFWKVHSATTYLNSIITDAYTLARIFKRFDITKSKAQNLNSNIHQPTRPHNIIIYGGNAHAILYREFLMSIGSVEVAQTSNVVGAKNCVNLENFPMPFFSNFPP